MTYEYNHILYVPYLAVEPEFKRCEYGSEILEASTTDKSYKGMFLLARLLMARGIS